MNVLVLTPDAVGSTLLQRLLTIYMQFHQFDKPVINIHELTNGLTKFYSPDFNREILTKRGAPSYHQSLEQVTQLLTEADHYKVARLAAYHIGIRQDNTQDQVPFYRYLDENYFVICTKRRNLFEHGLSWAINRITKKLNVYSREEKLNSFADMYQTGIVVDTEALKDIWNRYIKYLQWAEQHFSIGSYYYYEDHVDQIEKYILNLPIFAGQQKLLGWQDVYNIDFNTWNRCHYFDSNVGHLLSSAPEVQKLIAQSTSSELVVTQNNALSIAQNFLEKNYKGYTDAKESVDKMVSLGILTTPVPIKKQTLAEKKHIVKNFDECLAVYNEWILNYPEVAKPYHESEVSDISQKELKKWFSSGPGSDLITT